MYFLRKRINIDAILGEMQATTFVWIKGRAKPTKWNGIKECSLIWKVDRMYVYPYFLSVVW
ncbi:hypothetical protein HanRHA438_Chr15g0699141 [Helianthus annuus]|nr:hypothetical protein HanIR_Chr15g0746381 [Helianthus annuus]KAJ0844143.1 hypothetical protein HanRHA438_Chr15g0699141 [Helianthus annuus]